MSTPSDDALHMLEALGLARRGEGRVEPNPMVGCVIADGTEVLGEGWHQQFGGPHAEVNAIEQAGTRAKGATLIVTLEPCCHHGKTPPCTEAIIRAGVARVVIATRDPFPQVAGGGIGQLRLAGIEVDVGLLEDDARRLNAPYFKLIEHARPWVIAKWAMTLDGRMATRAGSSQWISNEKSRDRVHGLRGRMDAILVGRGTVEADDPLLTARPPGPRIATRIVVDSLASLTMESQLVQTAREVPVLVAVGPAAHPPKTQQLEAAGCEVLRGAADDREVRLRELLDELGRRRMTNVLVEGGAEMLGSFFDAGEVDEVHAFIAPKIVGGEGARSPVAGLGVGKMADALCLQDVAVEQLDEDVYLHGRIRR